MNTWRLILSIVALTLCTGAVPQEAAEAPSKGSARKNIKVDVNIYMPGTIPAGIGDPVKMADTIAEEWEALNPGFTITYQPVVNTGSSEGEWLKTQLIGGIAPEIINMNAESVWPDVGKGWFVPLDEFLERPNPYVEGNERWADIFTNQALLGAKRAGNGKLYCIPLDIVETGLYYNKDLLQKYGVAEPPETWAEMLRIFAEVQEDGVTPMTAGGNLASDWGQDILFEMLYHDILPIMDIIPSRPDAEGYLGHYLEPAEAGFLHSKGFFTARDPRWREMNRMLYEWRQYWAKELKNSDPMRLFLTGRMAFFWDGSWLIRRLAKDPYLDFEWGVTYLPPITKETSRFASGTPATVIGGAAVQLHVTNSAKINGNLEQVIDYLMFLSAPQNLERLTSEALMYIPNVNGAKMDPRLQPFQDIFQRRYCAIKWLDSMDGRYKKYWRRMLDLYLHDGVDLDGFLEMLDQNFTEWTASHRKDEDAEAWNFEEKMEPVWQERKERLLRELDPAH